MLKADELDVELVMPSSTTDYRGIKFKSGEALRWLISVLKLYCY